MRTRDAIPALLASFALGAAGCDWPLITDYQTRVAGAYQVTAPDTVKAGQWFVVSIRTAEPDPRWESAGDEVRSGTGGILIIPRNRRSLHGNQSTATVTGEVQHDVSLRLRTPGETHILVGTLIEAADGGESLGTIRRDLTVQ